MALECMVEKRKAEVCTMSPPWMHALQWMPLWLVQPFEKGEVEKKEISVSKAGHAQEAAGRGRQDHALVVRGPIAYCVRCARFAMWRLGSGLKGVCSDPQQKSLNAVQARLRRLRERIRPLTGRRLDLR